MDIELRSINDIKPYENNPRLNDAAVDAVAASLKEFGWRQPIVTDKDLVIVVGHTRYKAAKKLGLTHVPVHVATDLTPAQAKAYRIADNQAATLAEWNTDLLPLELADLKSLDFNLDLLGFDPDELARLMNAEDGAGLTDPDDVPAVPLEPITQPGDLWVLGEHRLLCGDSTKPEQVRQLMSGDRADLLLTDPPYNVDYAGKTKDALKIDNDAMKDGEFRRFLLTAFGSAFEWVKPGGAFYVFHADSEGYNFRGALHDLGQRVRQCLIWKKQTLVMGRQDYQWKHEPCLYGWKVGAVHAWYGDRSQTTVLEFDRPSRSEDHPTMKPVALFSYLLGNSTGPQGLVLDPFLGSGTTLIACQQLGRRCYGLELSPGYCDVIVKRWEEFTGKKGVRIGREDGGDGTEKTPADSAGVSGGGDR